MLGEFAGLDSACAERLYELKGKAARGNSFGTVQMDKGKPTSAYRLGLIRGGDLVAKADRAQRAHKSAKEGELPFTLRSSPPYCADIAELWAGL